MAGAIGVNIGYAIKKASAWGTAVAAGANNGLLLKPTTLKRSADVIIDDSMGTYFTTDGTPGAVKVEGDIPAYLRYDGLDELIAGFFGTAGVPSTHTAGTLSKDFLYKFNTSLDGIFWTFVKKMVNYVAEFPSAKIQSLTIKGEVGKPLEIIAKIIANNVVYNTTTGTNTLTTFNSVTIRETANRIQFGQGIFRLNSQSGAALAVGDKVYPIAFELNLDRNMSGVYGQYTTGISGNSQDLIDEPTNNGKPSVSLKLTFPRHATLASTVPAFLTGLNNDSRYKGDIVFTGGIIEGAIPRMFAMEFPNMQLKNVDITDAQGIIQEPIEFACHSALAAPTGMGSATALPNGKTRGADLTDPVWISGTNKFASDPLA